MEAKLFTEAEARIRFDHELAVELRERGLIAPEPVDPLLVEAREIAGKTLHRLGASEEQIAAGDITSGKRDDAIIVHATLAALKRGMEMRAPLTCEMVREAVDSVICHNLTAPDITAIHAALTKEQS